tara:strand:- start:119 stop:598 length:480 start_codon:yes stop_codon:yes gene_type:complete
MKTQLYILVTKLKALNFMKLITITSAFFLPICGILILIGAAVIMDTVTGIWKAKKLKQKVTSRKLSALVSKILLYEATVMLFFLMDKFLLNDIVVSFFGIELLTTKILALVLCSIEIISINENFQIVKGVDLFAALKNLFSRAKEITKSFKDIKKNEDL